ncbi:MAG: methylated-DNA--[protein]-cysteine S-methyltransferase [Bacillota bacterium]
MNTAIIETGAGFSGLCWTGEGLVVLNLPAPTLYDAENELRREIEKLPEIPGKSSGESGRVIDPKELEAEMQSYFSGKKVGLSFPVDWSCYTAFQRKVLQRVYSLKWGQAASYGQIAADIGSLRAARAVGGAVGSNRVLLVIPCHRVLAHNRGIGGFGSGLDWKRKLLGFEGINFLEYD